MIGSIKNAWVKFVKATWVVIAAPFLLALYVFVLLLALFIPSDKQK